MPNWLIINQHQWSMQKKWFSTFGQEIKLTWVLVISIYIILTGLKKPSYIIFLPRVWSFSRKKSIKTTIYLHIAVLLSLWCDILHIKHFLLIVFDLWNLLLMLMMDSVFYNFEMLSFDSNNSKLQIRSTNLFLFISYN